MQPRLRAAIAAALIAHSSRRQIASLYDHDAQARLDLHASAGEGGIACHDLADGSSLSGSLSDLRRSPEASRISVTESGADYRGFDHGSGTHFDVRPEGLSAWLYDHGEQSWFSYTAQPASF